MHIKQIERDPKCWKAERLQPGDTKKARWCIPLIFFFPIYLRASADGICNPGMSRDAELKGSNSILLSIGKEKGKLNELKDILKMWAGRIESYIMCPWMGLNHQPFS
jgi:hypothetical protein